MQAIRITGGRRLRGEFKLHGAKNAVLPQLAATLVSGGVCTLQNCPKLQDVENALEILRHLGCKATQVNDTITIDTEKICRTDVPQALMQKMRSSSLFLGALLARTGEASLFLPGGCVLGSRPINLHLAAMRTMGATVEEDGPALHCCAAPLHDATVVLTFPSVGATENIMLAALACKGSVTICNAAKEPEIADLAGFLRAMGARVYGDGTSVVQIHGGRKLHGACYRVMPDRIEAATILSAVAACSGDVTLLDVPVQEVYAVTELLQTAGAEIELGEQVVRIRANALHAPRPIRTAPYPGFPTDAQAPIMAALLKADGVTLIEETIFDNRFRHVSALRALGADIQVANRIARIRGTPELHGAPMAATDLRGGAAMAIGALSAEGVSTLSGVEHIRRGYTDFENGLRQLGAVIDTIEIP